MRIYNTLTRKKEEFDTHHAGRSEDVCLRTDGI